jgi:hypothetical protein
MSELTNLLPDGIEREDIGDVTPGSSISPRDDECDYLKGRGKTHAPELSNV